MFNAPHCQCCGKKEHKNGEGCNNPDCKEYYKLKGAIGGCMDAEKAFLQFWGKRWPFTSSNEKVLSLSANFRNTKEAFLAGWEASAKNTEQQIQADSLKKE